jgi:hypothetical protein
MAESEQTERRDFLISHAGRDRAWAEWVAWQLTEAGFEVELDYWHWAAGDNFVAKMRDALDRADRVLALFSAAYFEPARYTNDEWSAALVKDESARHRLLPVRIEDVTPPTLLRPILSVDLFGVSAAEARERLLGAARGARGRPANEPAFPGSEALGQGSPAKGVGPRLPGSVPQIWNIPARNRVFTGRDGVLVQVREQLVDSGNTVVQALQGMGGIGKTQLAIEYAHRFSGEYELAWWINSESAELISNQLTELAIQLDIVRPDASISAAWSALSRALRGRPRWLLIFDNAKNPEDLTAWLPMGGHVMITSRTPGWRGIAEPIEVSVFARSESMALLSSNLRGLREIEADALANAVGDLPLALAQASAIMEATGMPGQEYLHLLRTHTSVILNEGRALTYPTSLAAVTNLTFSQLAADDAAAAQLIELCSFLAPELIPFTLFNNPMAISSMPTELRPVLTGPWTRRRVWGIVGRYALAQVSEVGVQVHRLTQAIIRDQLGGRADETRAIAVELIAAADPGSPGDPRTWPGWGRLLPHILAAEPEAAINARLRDLACRASWYLLRRGDTVGSRELASRLYLGWRNQFGADHHHTLKAAHHFAAALRDLGEYGQARDLYQDCLTRQRKVQGDDHPDTLDVANNLGVVLHDLGEVEAARDLHIKIFNRRRQLLGSGHPHTLTSANHLANDFHDLGEMEEARELHADTLRRRRQLLGDDHPDTLISAYGLASDLYLLGQEQMSRELHEDTLERRLRILGEDHPDTLLSASSLALAPSAARRNGAASELDEEIINQHPPGATGNL